MSGLLALGRVSRAVRRLGGGRLLRAARDMADRLLVAIDTPPLRATVDGLELRGFLRHRSFLAHLARGDYEPLARETFRQGLAHADVVADVGAHIGFYSLLAAREAPDAAIVAFEPDPYNAAALRLNVRRAGAANVRVVERAAHDRAGRATFRQNEATTGSSLVLRVVGVGPARDIEVETTTLDAELGNLAGRRLLLKLDVEGAERIVLRGAAETLRGAAAVTAIVELHPHALREAGTTPRELVADLEGLGLAPRYLDEDSHAVVPLGDELRKGNLFGQRGRFTPR
ncbi:MAG: FkbM family methyltransferase [Gaiellaceae bacterium]